MPFSSGDKVPGPSSRLSNVKAVANAESAKRDAELRARFVVVPPGDEAKDVTCPICKEVLVDISCNVSCGGFGWEWFADGPFASGVREQSVRDT